MEIDVIVVGLGAGGPTAAVLAAIAVLRPKPIFMQRAKAQLLTDDGPIEGISAAAMDNNNMMRGRYPGGGAGLGPSMTVG